MTLFCLFTWTEARLTMPTQRVNLYLTSCQIDQVQALSQPLSQQIIWGQNIPATSATRHRLSSQSPVSILALLTSSPWNIEFLSTVERAQNRGPGNVRPATSVFLIKDTRVKTVLQWRGGGGGAGLPQKASVGAVVGDNFECERYCMGDARQGTEILLMHVFNSPAQPSST